MFTLFPLSTCLLEDQGCFEGVCTSDLVRRLFLKANPNTTTRANAAADHGETLKFKMLMKTMFADLQCF